MCNQHMFGKVNEHSFLIMGIHKTLDNPVIRLSRQNYSSFSFCCCFMLRLRSEVNNSQRLDWELKKWLTASGIISDVSSTYVLNIWYRYRYLYMQINRYRYVDMWCELICANLGCPRSQINGVRQRQILAPTLITILQLSPYALQHSTSQRLEEGPAVILLQEDQLPRQIMFLVT